MNNLNFLHIGRGKQQHQSLLGDTFEELCKKATDKTLFEPDQDAISAVTERILYANETSLTSDSAGDDRVARREQVNALKKRLNMHEPQKQWLAVHLVRAVLRDCPEEIGPYTGELLHEVAKIATKPQKRLNTAQKRATDEAQNLLRQHGTVGQSAYLSALRDRGSLAGPGPTDQYYTPPRGYASPNQYGSPLGGANAGDYGVTTVEDDKGDLYTEVQIMIDTCQLHTDVLQDLILQLSGGEQQDTSFEKGIITELVKDVKTLKQKLPIQLEKLANTPTPEAEALMCSALEASDMLDNALALHAAVAAVAQNEPKTAPTAGIAARSAATRPQGGSSSGAGGDVQRQGSFSDLLGGGALPNQLMTGGGGGGGGGGVAAAGGPASNTADPFGLDELQEALDQTNFGGNQGPQGAGQVQYPNMGMGAPQQVYGQPGMVQQGGVYQQQMKQGMGGVGGVQQQPVGNPFGMVQGGAGMNVGNVQRGQPGGQGGQGQGYGTGGQQQYM